MSTSTSRYLLVVLALSAAAPAAAWFGVDREATLELPTGTVEVRIDPDHGRPLALRPAGAGRWVVDGLDEASYGRAYDVEISNRTPERLKVVVAIDGVNVYERVPYHGRSHLDVGSILEPWGRRTLTGWQIGLDAAERFVLAPGEWSEGRGIADAAIGTIVVDVYRERPPVPPDRCDDLADGESSRRQRRESAGESAPLIGTTSGDRVTSRVRVVSFTPRTQLPEARAEIDYGRPDAPQRRPRIERVLGLELAADRDGAVVASVRPGSAADRAGIERGDVLVRVDGEHRPEPDRVRRIVDRKRAGDRLFVWVRRGPHELAVKIRVS